MNYEIMCLICMKIIYLNKVRLRLNIWYYVDEILNVFIILFICFFGCIN